MPRPAHPRRRAANAKGRRPVTRKEKDWDALQSKDELDFSPGMQDLLRLTAGAASEGAQVRRIQPSQARKTYLCPGCQQEISVGVGHVVVVPLDAPDLRRHWHSSCWLMRDRRRPGR